VGVVDRDKNCLPACLAAPSYTSTHTSMAAWCVELCVCGACLLPARLLAGELY